jgi:hypothetical protein
VSFFDLKKIIFPGEDVFFEFQLFVSIVSYDVYKKYLLIPDYIFTNM